MKIVSCKDISPESTCSFEVSGKMDKEVVNKMFGHVKKDHADDVAGMNSADIRTMIESKVHEI